MDRYAPVPLPPFARFTTSYWPHTLITRTLFPPAYPTRLHRCSRPLPPPLRARTTPPTTPTPLGLPTGRSPGIRGRSKHGARTHHAHRCVGCSTRAGRLWIRFSAFYTSLPGSQHPRVTRFDNARLPTPVWFVCVYLTCIRLFCYTTLPTRYTTSANSLPVTRFTV